MAVKIVAGNWKMNLNRGEAQALVSEITGMLSDEVTHPVKVILFPANIYIGAIVQLTSSDHRIAIGAQNCSNKESGAFTGEVSAAMLKSIGCHYVLIGHSERRAYFGETNTLLSEKIDLAIKHLLHPVYCIGELLEDRNNKKHFDVIQNQLTEGIFHLDATAFEKCIIAYEPVWAIGTGLTASAEQAQEMHAYIRQLIEKKYGGIIAENTTILYGGSCNDQNAKELFGLKDVDGGLIGGASLKSRSFVNIIKSLP
ncbi:MAG: triose-phosphate isomerase [Bacteroidetes bacterium]|nr:triose-phosphate isomerase [Bacteroidota bacterium]MBL0097847.1 triose-phosphate isomerase [Bacteroidota bacterium]